MEKAKTKLLKSNRNMAFSKSNCKINGKDCLQYDIEIQVGEETVIDYKLYRQLPNEELFQLDSMDEITFKEVCDAISSYEIRLLNSNDDGIEKFLKRGE